MSKLRVVLFHHQRSNVAYDAHWYNALCASPSLEIIPFSAKLASQMPEADTVICRAVAEADFVFFMHVTNAQKFLIPEWLMQVLEKDNRTPIVFFSGNEYKMCEERTGYINRMRAEWVISLLPQEAAEWLYQDCQHSHILSLPHALNHHDFQPRIAHASRPIDIGVRGLHYPHTLGDFDRTRLIDFFQSHPAVAHLKRDILYTTSQDMLPMAGWADFLNHCKGTISTEAGGPYVDKDGQIAREFDAYIRARPTISIPEAERWISERFATPVSGKCISSRHFEAIGTKTCQIMFPGSFSDILEADVHYISLQSDFSNIRDVLAKFEDEAYRQRIVDVAYDYAMAQHTYDHRVAHLVEQITAASLKAKQQA